MISQAVAGINMEPVTFYKQQLYLQDRPQESNENVRIAKKQ